MKGSAWSLLLLAGTTFFVGALFQDIVMDRDAEASPIVAESSIDPYTAEWCQVEAVNYDVMLRPRDCQTWVLACPTGAKSCRWVPVEIVPPPTESVDEAE